MQNVLAVLVFLVVVGLLEGLFHVVRWLSQKKEGELRRRLRTLDGTVESPTAGLLRKERFARSPVLDAFVRALPGARALERLLAQADVDLTVARLLTFSAAGLLLGLTVPSAVGAGLAPGLFLGAGAAAAPVLWLHSTRARRSARLSEQLPEALDMMSRSLRAGHALPSAFRLVAAEMPPPVSVEFGRAYEEQRLGLAAEQAVVNMSGRTPDNRDVAIFAVSVVVQKETGGNLAEILDNIAATIRDRYRFYSKLRALTAEGRTSGLVLGSLPICMALFLAVANPVYFSRFFDNPIGQAIFLYAFASWAAGGWWLMRMAKVDY